VCRVQIHAVLRVEQTAVTSRLEENVAAVAFCDLALQKISDSPRRSSPLTSRCFGCALPEHRDQRRRHAEVADGGALQRRSRVAIAIYPYAQRCYMQWRTARLIEIALQWSLRGRPRGRIFMQEMDKSTISLVHNSAHSIRMKQRYRRAVDGRTAITSGKAVRASNTIDFVVHSDHAIKKATSFALVSDQLVQKSTETIHWTAL
jgi:hypothetical protein